MAVQCLSKRVIGSNKLRKSQSACKFRGFTCPCKTLAYECFCPRFRLPHGKTALSLFKGAKAKGLQSQKAAAKIECPENLRRTVRPCRIEHQHVLRCLLGNNAQAANSKKKLGQPTACSLGLSTAYDGLRPLLRGRLSVNRKLC